MEALAAIPFIASFGSFLDDTSILADLILPDHSLLESWVDSAPESGSIEAVTTSAGPVMKPLYSTRATADVLIEVAGKLKTRGSRCRGRRRKKLASQSAVNSLSLSRSRGLSRSLNPQSAIRNLQCKPSRAGLRRRCGDVSISPAATRRCSLGDGIERASPRLQEMPDPLTSAMWSSWVEINPQTAERLQLAQGDLADLTSSQGTVRVPVMIFRASRPISWRCRSDRDTKRSRGMRAGGE